MSRASRHQLKPIPVESRIDLAVAALTGLITSGAIKVGEYLPTESSLREQLGVSRPTVREALRTLEARGLVTSRQGVGVQVTDRAVEVISDSIGLMLLRRGAEHGDLLEVRSMIEGEAAALAALRATDEDHAAILATIEALSAPNMELEALVQADLDFHSAVADASHNGVLVALIHALRGLLHDVIHLSHDLDPDVRGRLFYHQGILEAIRAHDSAGARALMRQHLDDAAQQVSSRLQEQIIEAAGKE